jgi:DNA-binding FadR family transcriptional regulator
MFKQAKQNRAFEDIISQIQELILRGEIKAGDKLPSERQLQEMFKVSRGTLREAFRALEQKGLIAIKTGVKGGAIVCAVDTKQMSESLDLLLRYQKISLRELSEFREEVEGLLAAKAAQKAKKEDVSQLKTLLKSIENLLPFGVLRWDEIFKVDKEFHLTLARISENRMYESVLYTVYDNINRYFERFLSKNIAILKNTHQELCKITEAIEKKNPDMAKVFLKKHVRRYYRMMEEREKLKEANAQN